MATWTASFNSSYQLELVVTQESQSVTNNTSSVKGVLRMKKLAGSGNWANDKKSTWNMSLNGSRTSGTFSFDFRNYTTLQLTSRTITVTHNSDGAKSINVSASSWADLATPATATIGTKSFGLTTIPRASTASLGGATTTGFSISVSISRKSSSFTHNVRYKIGSGSWVTVATAATTSAYFTIGHTSIAANGSATVTVQVQTKSGSTNIGGVITLTRTVYGPKTNSIATFNNFTIGNTIPFTITRPNSSFTSTARIYVGGTLVQTLTGLGTSGTFSANTATYLGKLPSNGKSTTVTIQLDTMSGSTKIGSTVSKSATATGTDAQLQPSVPSISLTQVGSSINAYIQRISKVRVSVTATSPYNSTISSYSISIGGINYIGSTATSDVLNTSGLVTISATVRNSRGISRTATTTINVVKYAPARILKFTAQRDTSNPTTLRVQYSFDIKSVNNANSRTYRLRYRKAGDTSWTTYFTKTDKYSDDTSISIPGIVSEDYRYEIEFYCKDSFGEVAALAFIPAGYALINFNASGKGMAVGQVSTGDLFEVNMPSTFTKNVTSQENFRLKAPPTAGGWARGLRFETASGNNYGTIGHYGNQDDPKYIYFGGDYNSTGNLRWNVDTGTLSIGDYPIADFVIEAGDNYTKWFSGKFEQWGYSQVVTNSSGVGTFNYPIPFSTSQTVIVTITPNYNSSRYISYTAGSSSTTITVYFNLKGNAPLVNANQTFRYHSIGKWK